MTHIMYKTILKPQALLKKIKALNPE